MVSIGKKIISDYAEFNCERLVKKILNGEKGLEPGKKRPGIGHISEEGNRWGKHIYNDLIEAVPELVIFSYNEEKEEYDNIDGLDILKKNNKEELLIIEADFETPNETFNIPLSEYKMKNSRPDILWIRRMPNSDKLIISIIDVKTTPEPSLKHFSELTYYKLVLERILKNNNLDSKYEIDFNGFIWPGNHDKYVFRTEYKKFTMQNQDTAFEKTLNEILIEVPFDLYLPLIKTFFDDNLQIISESDENDVKWHFSSKCMFCDHEVNCKKESKQRDHISQIAFLSRGQHDLLVDYGIENLDTLIDNVESASELWQEVEESNILLNSQKKLLLTRAKALHEEKVLPLPERKTHLFPKFANLNIYLNFHFDPISGITYAMGAKSVYISSDYDFKPQYDTKIHIVKQADMFNVTEEEDAFVDLVKWINEKLNLVDQKNMSSTSSAQNNLEKVHFFLWENLEVSQIKRMMMRHITKKRVRDEIQTILKFFPPENELDNPDIYQTQPGSVVQDTIKHLFGLPIKFYYSLNDVYNCFQEENQQSPLYLSRGFHVDMSDQIPFERAYEVWKNEVFLPKYGRLQDIKTKQELYELRNKKGFEKLRNIDTLEELHSLDEIDALKNIKFEVEDIMKKLRTTVKMRLDMLSSVSYHIQSNYGELLLLKKKGLKKINKKRIGFNDDSEKLYIFEYLNQITQEIEDKQKRALPIEEKESRFLSIRGLSLIERSPYDNIINEVIMEKHPTRNINEFLVFKYSQNSIDTKLKEGDFLICLSNEKDQLNNTGVQMNLDLSFNDSLPSGQHEDFKIGNKKIKDILSIEIVKISYDSNNPWVIILPNDFQKQAFSDAIDYGLLNLDEPLILDAFYKDFGTDIMKNVLKAIGKE